MKTNKKLWKSIASALILLVLIVMVTASCKKKDDEPIPTPPTPSSSPFLTKIDGKLPQLRTNAERASHRKLPCALYSKTAKSLGGASEDFEKIGDVLWEIHDYEHTEMEFAKIDNALTQIQSQLAYDSIELNAIAAEIQLSTIDIEEWITKQDVYSSMTSIYTLFGDSTSRFALMFYPSVAARIQRGDNTIPLTTLQEYATTYINDNNNANVSTLVNKIADQILTEGALSVFTKQIILNNGQPSGAGNPANLMNSYKLLENYFLQLVSYQLQGMCIIANVDNALDSTGGTWKLNFTGFQNKFKSELIEFYSQCDYLFINLYDYRNNDQFNMDAKNCAMGLSWDQSLGNAKTRAQFIGNVILDGLGLPYSPVGGSVVIPYNYGFNGTVNSIKSLSVTGPNGQWPQTVPGSYPDGFKSIYPNTTLSANAVCNTSNLWNIFHFSEVDNKQSGETSFVFALGGGNSPWVHTTDIVAGFEVLYYDPETGASSMTKDSVHTMLFGYAPFVWWWGDLFQNFNSLTDCSSYLLNNTGGNYSYAPSPGIGYWDGDEFYEQFLPAGGSFVTNTAFVLGYSGPMVGTENVCVVNQAQYLDLSYETTSAGCELFTFYQTDPPNYSTSSNDFFTVWAGTGWEATPQTEYYYYSNANIMDFGDANSNPRTGVAINALSGQSSSINAGYQWMDGQASSSTSHSFHLYWCSQLVFKGTSAALP